MQRNPTGRRLSIVAASAALVLLAACGRPGDDNATVGQRIDQGVATAEQKMEEGQAAAERKAEQAGNAMERAGERAANATADASLTAAVKTALLTAPELGATRINVDTDNGVVTLKGEVKTAVEKDRAQQVASTVAGVQTVNNQLQVSG